MRLHESLSELFAGHAPPRQVVWVGALSFEPRCTGSISTLLGAGFEVVKAVAFDYPTHLTPKNNGEQRRASNRAELARLLPKSLSFRLINPYRYAEFVGELYRLIQEVNRDFDIESVQVVIDITCLTKIHTLALAYWLLNRTEGPTITLAYSQPEYYGNPSKNIWGKSQWQNTILVRLDLDSTETYSSTHAILLIGHEGDRLHLALSEIEPSDALIIKALPKDPESTLLTVSDVQNSWLFLEMKEGIRRHFKKVEILMRDIDQLNELVSQYCRNAKMKNARVVLCPFGPKTFVFFAGYSGLSEYSKNIWLSYPRPISYDPEYSDGYNYTLWFSATG